MPVSYWGFASFDDLIVAIVLIFIIVAMAIEQAVYFILRGPWGALFWHSDKLQVVEEFQQEGSVDAYTVRNFGSLKQVKGGDKKGQFVIPRQNSTFKAPHTPLLSIVLGRGIGHQVNPYIAEYLRRMGGKWPEWSGPKPPGTPKDTDQMYLMYAKWKAAKEDSDSVKKSRESFINEHINDIPIETGLPQDVKNAAIDERRKSLGDVFDTSLGGGYKAILTQLQNPSLDMQSRNALYEYMNGEIQSEPVELWPTWIAGFQVSLQNVAQFVEPISAAELTYSMVLQEKAILKGQHGDLIKFVAVGMLILMAFVGAGIAYKLVAG